MLKILKPNIKIVQKIMGLVYYNLVSIWNGPTLGASNKTN
jgi:hypothetical protein